MIRTGNKTRLRPLIMQSVASGAFLGMCIWACFTAFYRTGEITVSSLSAVLMSVFFALFGLTVGIYVLSFTLNKKPLWSVTSPALAAIITVTVMYIGEMVLLDGHLYRFGQGFLFDGLPGIVLAPVDIVVILLSGALTALIAHVVRKK
jgi:DMSO reductase anchor subunit